MTVELKGCPFCGLSKLRLEGSGEGFHWVVCEHECRAEGPVCYGEAASIEAWNRRVPQPVKIRPLEWEKLGYGFFRAPAPLFGNIRVEHYGDEFTVSYSLPGYSNTFAEGAFGTEEQALAAAEAEYQKRMASVVMPPN